MRGSFPSEFEVERMPNPLRVLSQRAIENSTAAAATFSGSLDTNGER